MQLTDAIRWIKRAIASTQSRMALVQFMFSISFLCLGLFVSIYAINISILGKSIVPDWILTILPGMLVIAFAGFVFVVILALAITVFFFVEEAQISKTKREEGRRLPRRGRRQWFKSATTLEQNPWRFVHTTEIATKSFRGRTPRADKTASLCSTRGFYI